MEFLRFEAGVTTYEDVKELVGDCTFSVLTFSLFGSVAQYEAFVRYAVVVEDVKCNLYKNTAFGTVPLNKDGMGMAGGIGGTVGIGIPPKNLSPDDQKVYDLLDSPERLMDLHRVFMKLVKDSKSTTLMYLVKSFFPSPIPGVVLDDAVRATKKWAKKVHCAR